jgi:hypothetical protein
MATALDVAEAVATVLPTKHHPGRGALDDVIRRQLADQSVARRTAVTDGKPPSTHVTEPEPTSTGLFRKTDSDGLSRLEEADEEAGGEASGESNDEADGEAHREAHRAPAGAPANAPAEAKPPRAPSPRAGEISPRKRREPGEPPGPGDEPKDRDRRTEVGEPPIGQIPKPEGTGANAGGSPRAAPGCGSRSPRGSPRPVGSRPGGSRSRRPARAPSR